MNEIVADIFTWAWFSEPHGYNFNGHLVRHAGGNFCIDPVPPTDACLAEIARMGIIENSAHQSQPFTGCQLVRARTAPRRSFTRTTPRMLAARELKSMGH